MHALISSIHSWKILPLPYPILSQFYFYYTRIQAARQSIKVQQIGQVEQAKIVSDTFLLLGTWDVHALQGNEALPWR